MLIELVSFSTENAEFFNQAMNIRFTVFSKELGIDKNIEFDGLDYEQAVHYLVIIDSKPIATLRWRQTKEGIIIDKLAVLKEYRHLSIGQLLLRHVLQELKKSKKKIYLNSYVELTGFFNNHNFDVISEPFESNNRKVVKMIYKKK